MNNVNVIGINNANPCVIAGGTPSGILIDKSHFLSIVWNRVGAVNPANIAKIIPGAPKNASAFPGLAWNGTSSKNADSPTPPPNSWFPPYDPIR